VGMVVKLFLDGGLMLYEELRCRRISSSGLIDGQNTFLIHVT
jgi:hypothetical protein